MGDETRMAASRLPVLFFVLPIAACSGPSARTGEIEDRTVGDEATEEPAVLSDLQRLNARAREGAVSESFHGVAIDDPYRSLEGESELTREWIDFQTRRTDAALRGWTDPNAAARLDTLLMIGVLDRPDIAGERVFFMKREGDREQPALYVREGDRTREAPLIDPLTYGERAALDWYFPSPNGRYVAFGISTSGDERSTLRVIEVESGRVLSDTIDHAKWGGVAWLNSEDGFYYRRYPREGEPDWDPEAQDTYHMRLFFHRLGDEIANDALVFAPPDNTAFPTVSVSEDDRWLVVGNFRGWSESDLYLFDRGANRRARLNAPTEARPLAPVVVGQAHLYNARVHRGTFYVWHNDGAPRYRVQSARVERATDRASWRDVVAEGEFAIDHVEIAGDRILVHAIENIASRIRVYRTDGTPDGEIELPVRGELSSLVADARTGRVVLGFSSFVYPPALFSWSARDRTLREIDRVHTDFDFDSVRLGQASVRSADGTEINVYYVHPRDMALDGRNRVLLNAYGGFNVSLLPGFQRIALYWAERGGVFAVANLRGGGEFGEDWHRAGNLANKERVFEDFEAVIRWLGGESNISRPERIAIHGGSNGGLLMGAAITRAPETFRAVVANVGLYDMLRYHHFPPAELWITEYGSADDAEQFPWLHGYSPYHRVEEGARLPAILVTTADHDTRVFWGHSTKFAARLQESTHAADPDVYFHMVREQGHGAGQRRSDTVERYLRLFTFVEHFIGGPDGG
jgi:prolyl oligopeptidase